jgi:hypothetical protein
MLVEDALRFSNLDTLNVHIFFMNTATVN